MRRSFSYVRLGSVLICLFFLPIMAFSQLSASIAGTKSAAFTTRTLPSDTTSGSGGAPHHCQLKLQLPDTVDVAAILLEIKRPGQSGKMLQKRIPLTQKRGRSYQNIGIIRQGGFVWLDFGTVQGNPNYTATIRLEDQQGQLSAPVNVLASP